MMSYRKKLPKKRIRNLPTHALRSSERSFATEEELCQRILQDPYL